MSTDGFDKLSPLARGALAVAHAEARKLNHDCIGTEHLLLGLVSKEGGEAALALRALGVDADRARELLLQLKRRGKRRIAGDLALSPRLKKVIEAGIREAARLGSNGRQTLDWPLQGAGRVARLRKLGEAAREER